MRGLWFLSPYALWLEKTGQLVFPSPCGDYGSYQGGGNVDKTKDPCKFPSPCGDYGSYLKNNIIVFDTESKVSVPLRGLWFLSRWTRTTDLTLIRFPSPCGDYGSYRKMRRTNGKSLRNSFRPLAGIMVLISDFDPDDSSGIHVRFRPLAGIMVLIEEFAKYIVVRGIESFRPLAGIMVLILIFKERMILYAYKVSVPLRGLWFLSPPRASLEG